MKRPNRANPGSGARRRPKASPTSVPTGKPFLPPYPPSWIDRLTDLIDRAPGPAWLALAVLGVAGVVLQLTIQAAAGDYRPGSFLPLHIWITSSFAYLLGMIYYLDKAAASAAEIFRPVLQPSHPEADHEERSVTYAELRYRLTTLPPKQTMWAAFLGCVFLGLGSQSLFDRTIPLVMSAMGFSIRPGAVVAVEIHHILTQAIAGVLVYHTIHQLRLIHHIYLHHTQLNLYRLQPLYAFSVPAALTAAGFLAYNYFWFAASPALLQEPVGRALGAFFSVIALVTFAWPLWGIHRRLVLEKKKLLEESSVRFEATVAQLHERVDSSRLERMDDLNKTLASLELEQAALRRIPTWPWEPGTVRGVAVAVLLPIIIWLIQTVLGRLLQ